ncbi:MAG: hypothetical protein ABJA81_04990 [Nocardioidaceae bacterium]
MARRSPMKLLLTSVIGVLALLAPASVTAEAEPAPATAAVPALAGTMLLGATSSNWTWFDNAVGPQQIYRNFDQGFNYATWQDTPAYKLHPNATANDYSTEVLPQRLLDPTDTINAMMRAFIATTPKNIIMTNLHEPDEAFQRRGFTQAQFRASILTFAQMVRDQNAIDGGTRMTSVVLMGVTFGAYGTTTADQWWPTDARDGGHVDILEADLYALPHATQTACCPAGYTDGVSWRKAPQVIDPLRNFAQARGTPWAISELGYLEDIHNPQRKATALSEAVAYARTWGAHHVEVFDSAGTRASWKLWHSFPVGTQSSTSNAALMWKSLVAGS